MRVDKSREDVQAAGIDLLRLFRRFDMGRNLSDFAIPYEKIAGKRSVLHGMKHPVFDQKQARNPPCVGLV